MACGWSGGGGEGNYLLGERPLHGVARYSPSTGTEASHCSQWSHGIAAVALTVAVLILPEFHPAAAGSERGCSRYLDNIGHSMYILLCV